MTLERKRTLIVFLAPLTILLIPLIAMLFTNEVKWGALDFLVAAVLLYGTAFIITAIFWKIKNKRTRILLLSLVVAMLLLLWAELAVGIFKSPLAGS